MPDSWIFFLQKLTVRLFLVWTKNKKDVKRKHNMSLEQKSKRTIVIT